MERWVETEGEASDVMKTPACYRWGSAIFKSRHDHRTISQRHGQCGRNVTIIIYRCAGPHLFDRKAWKHWCDDEKLGSSIRTTRNDDPESRNCFMLNNFLMPGSGFSSHLGMTT